MDTQNKVLEILKSVGAIKTGGHFIYASGKHGSAYVNKDAVYPHTRKISDICRMIAERFRDRQIDVVCAPSLGGIILSQWTAFHLSQITGLEVLGIYTEKTPERNQILTRGYDKLVKGKRVLIAEDVTTTGGSVRKVVEAVKQAGGQIEAVTVLVNRDSKAVTGSQVGAEFIPMSTLEFDSYDAADCPLCRDKVPVNTDVGKGREFLAQKSGL